MYSRPLQRERDYCTFKVIQHVLQSASNKDHTVAYAHMWRDQTALLRPGHSCMMSDDRAYELNVLRLVCERGQCGDWPMLSIVLLRFVGSGRRYLRVCLSPPTLDQR